MPDLVRSLVHVIHLEDEIFLRQLHLVLDALLQFHFLAVIRNNELNRHRNDQKRGTDYRQSVELHLRLLFAYVLQCKLTLLHKPYRASVLPAVRGYAELAGLKSETPGFIFVLGR